MKIQVATNEVLGLVIGCLGHFPPLEQVPSVIKMSPGRAGGSPNQCVPRAASASIVPDSKHGAASQQKGFSKHSRLSQGLDGRRKLTSQVVQDGKTFEAGGLGLGSADRESIFQLITENMCKDWQAPL
jgi:hypothetical protein